MAPDSPRRRRSESPAKWQARKDAEIKALLDRFDEGIQAVGSPEAWRSYLSFVANNYRYSPTNLLLIMMQLDNPTAIRGYKAWQDLGRQVRKGEKGAWIRQRVTVPAKDDDGNPRLDKDGKPLRSIVNFKWTKVFDIGQTDGPPIPDLTRKAINGKVARPVVKALEAHVKTLGYRLEVGLTGAADGYTDPEKKVVVLSAKLNEAEAVATLIHEIAHIELDHVADLDAYRQHRGEMEVAAESVAYVVGETLGLDALASSSTYVAGWAKGDPKVMREQVVAIGDAARRILKAEPMQQALNPEPIELAQ